LVEVVVVLVVVVLLLLLSGEGGVSEVAAGSVDWVWVGAKGGGGVCHGVGASGCVLCGLVLALLLVLLGVDALVLLEVLGTLEGLAADVAVVWLERGVYADVGCDVVTLCAADVAALPFAGEAEVVCGLAADVVVAEVLVDDLGVVEDLAAVIPSAGDGLGGRFKVAVIRC
jgi:hypothetical protein